MKKMFRKLIAPFAMFSIVIGLMMVSNQNDINLEVNAAEGDVITTWSDKATGYTSGYKTQTASIDGRDWVMTIGQSGYFGANKATTHNSAKITGDSLNAAKGVDSTWTASTVGMYGVISQSPLLNVNKVDFSYTANDGNSASTEVYLVYSNSLTTIYQQVPLLIGTQGSQPGAAKAVTYSFSTIPSAYYALMFKTSSFARFTSASIKFYEGVSATGTISISNSSERVLLGNNLVITPTLGGTGTLTASIDDNTIASITTTATQVTLNSLKVGFSDVTISFGGSNVTLQLEVFEPRISLSKSSLRLLPEQASSVTATPHDFTPTSYLWTKEDPNGVISLTNTTSSTVAITASAILGSAIVSVEVSDGSITKQQSLTVTVEDIAEGKYTISSNTTTYTNPILISQINVAKTVEDLGDIAISDINDIRAGASPNTGHISLGGSSSTGGSITFTLPEGLYAISVKFNGMIVDSGKTPTLSINNGVSFKYSSGTSSSTLYPYANSLVIMTSPSRIWVSSIEIEARSGTNASIDFGTRFINQTASECSNQNVSTGTWSNFETIFNGMDANLKTIIRSTSANNDGNDLEKAIGRYNFIVNKYSYNAFLETSGGPLDANPVTKENNPIMDSTINPLMIVSMIGFATFAAYFYLKKKHTI